MTEKEDREAELAGLGMKVQDRRAALGLNTQEAAAYLGMNGHQYAIVEHRIDGKERTLKEAAFVVLGMYPAWPDWAIENLDINISRGQRMGLIDSLAIAEGGEFMYGKRAFPRLALLYMLAMTAKRVAARQAPEPPEPADVEI